MRAARSSNDNRGSVELIVICLLAALIIIVAVPYLRDLGTNTQTSLSAINAQL